MYSDWPKDRRSILWDAAFVIGGLILVGTTFRAYRFFELSTPARSHGIFSPGDADNRIASARTYLGNHPDNYSALTDLAIAYFQKGPVSYIEGLNALEKARAAGATSEELFYYAGVMYDTLGLPEYAINELSKYLRHHPDDYESLVRMGNLFYRESKFAEAQLFYREALRQSPKDPTVWFNLAIVNKEKGNFDEALSDLQEVIKLAGQLPEGGFYQQGEIYRLKGSDDLAVQAYHEQLTVRPDYVLALTALESLLKRKGEIKEARNIHKRILDVRRTQSSPHPADQ